ncbi:hypothetical protein [Fibrobacter succinogenes]|uniref:hypothetical protein n=1 Tax=Fibrobacter succinogenes TaxID=833 RepID=UPI0012DC1BCE|nr:hypothetical protein [Fibrobacter succinogenes]
MAKIAKMAKFDEKMRFLVGGTAKKVQKCVRGWLKNAIEWAQAKLVFQKVTVGVSLVKQSVRQNEMGTLLARFVISSQWLSCVPVSTFWH